jgi:surface antigen
MMFGTICRAALVALCGLTAGPLWASAVLQCVPYARIVSGVEIRGDALSWWDQAEKDYKRGHRPKKGAVLAFRPNGPMVLGHVAVVSKVLDDRRVLVRHANWSVPGAIEEDVPVVDVSANGDWSEVRVWHSPSGQMGARTNPTYGFIYPIKAKLHDFTPDATLGSSVRLASAGADDWNGPAVPRTRAEPAAVAGNRAPAEALHARAQSMFARAERKGDGKAAPRLKADPFVTEYADAAPSERTLSAIIADVKREAVMN